MTVALGSFAAAMVYGLTTTAIVWKVPNSGNWVLVATLVLVAIVLAFCYKAARRAVPPDFKGGKWAATVLILGGDTASNNVTPTQRAVGFFIIMGVLLAGIALSLVWPDRPSWVLWAETGLILAAAASFIYKAARFGRPAGARVTPAPVGLFVATMVYACGTTAIVWKWPDSSPWISTSMAALLIAGIWVWAYRATRKKI
jgi:hypothetical protein